MGFGESTSETEQKYTRLVRLATMISPQTMTAVKDWVQVLAVPAALFGLIRGIYEIGATRKQRADELRWKQAQAAKELLDETHNHELAKQAIHMLDWVDGSTEYTCAPQEFNGLYRSLI